VESAREFKVGEKKGTLEVQRQSRSRGIKTDGGSERVRSNEEYQFTLQVSVKEQAYRSKFWRLWSRRHRRLGLQRVKLHVINRTASRRG
jgi:hypothetical protein